MLEVTLGYRAERHHHAVTAMAWVPAATSTSTDASPVVGDSNTLPPSSPNHVLFTASRDSTLRSWTVAAPLVRNRALLSSAQRIAPSLIIVR